MRKIWSDKKMLYWKLFLIGLFVVAGFVYILFIGITSMFEPREISYTNYLPSSATDINEKTEYIQSGPDEEYRYYLKAKITEEEFLQFSENLKLEWASTILRGSIPLKSPKMLWWNPPTPSFLYAKGNDADYSVQADYVFTTGHLYMYIEQN